MLSPPGTQPPPARDRPARPYLSFARPPRPAPPDATPAERAARAAHAHAARACPDPSRPALPPRPPHAPPRPPFHSPPGRRERAAHRRPQPQWRAPLVLRTADPARHRCCDRRAGAGCRPCGAQLRIISSFFLLLSIRVARVKCRGRREAEACLCWGRRGRSRCRLHWGDEACHRCTNALSCASGQMAPGPGALLRGVRDGGHCKVDLTRHGAA